jgi:hypothetical protein
MLLLNDAAQYAAIGGDTDTSGVNVGAVKSADDTQGIDGAVDEKVHHAEGEAVGDGDVGVEVPASMAETNVLQMAAGAILATSARRGAADVARSFARWECGTNGSTAGTQAFKRLVVLTGRVQPKRPPQPSKPAVSSGAPALQSTLTERGCVLQWAMAPEVPAETPRRSGNWVSTLSVALATEALGDSATA